MENELNYQPLAVSAEEEMRKDANFLGSGQTNLASTVPLMDSRRKIRTSHILESSEHYFDPQAGPLTRYSLGVPTNSSQNKCINCKDKIESHK